MERENRDIVTPVNQHKVKIKSWLTARERREIRSVLLDGVKFSTKGEEENPLSSYDLDATSLNKMQDKTLEVAVISVDGKTENLLNIILDMREKDYNFIIEEIDKITVEMDKDTKKK